jgi:L-alanine-DL-glutamate epimerase-like enolase superfamily enzyme
MKITALETIHLAEFTNILFVRVHTDEGLIGLGETYRNPEAVAGFIHGTAAAHLLGQDPLRIDYHWRRLYEAGLTFKGRGAEVRGLSAIDIALWDIFGQATGQPIYGLLGGASRERIRVYNTCAGYGYGRNISGLPTTGLGEPARGPYEDDDAFMHRADELALSLLEQGITAMKIWPFDGAARETWGQSISTENLKQGLEPFRKIRRAVGDRMEIMVELHSLWSLPAALRIARALEEFAPTWYEDPIRMDNIATLAEFARSTPVPTCASETLATRWAFRELFEAGATAIAMLDVAWTGGISEAKRIATLAETYHRPVAPHDCTGPVTLIASVHLCINVPNALIQETVRAFYTGHYPLLVTALPRIEAGYIYPPEGSGLGAALRPEVFTRPDLTRRVSEAR